MMGWGGVGGVDIVSMYVWRSATGVGMDSDVRGKSDNLIFLTVLMSRIQ